MYYVYFAKSLKNNKIYVGFTSKDPTLRVVEHNNGANNWTSKNGPFKLIYYDSFICESDARLREKYFKTGVGKRVKYAIVREFDREP